MAQINPYVRFNDGKCREAFEFYKACIGGELKFQTVGETPMAKDMPAESHSNIMHVELKSGKIELFGSDMMRDKAVVGDNIVLALNCDSEEEIKMHFAKLSEGGEVFMPLDKTFWGALFGVFTDKYGVEWMLNFQVEEMK
ncbi:MAG: VOC family protein [Patescibacteria group bacterium]